VSLCFYKRTPQDTSLPSPLLPLARHVSLALRICDPDLLDRQQGEATLKQDTVNIGPVYH